MDQPTTDVESDLVTRPTFGDIESDLVDLSHTSLADLPALDDQVIAPAMRRLLRRADDPASITSGYNPQRLD